RRYDALLVRRGRICPRVDLGFAHLRIIAMQLAVPGDVVVAAIGDEEIVECPVRIYAVGGDLKPQAIDFAVAFGAQTLLHLLEDRNRRPRSWECPRFYVPPSRPEISRCDW